MPLTLPFAPRGGIVLNLRPKPFSFLESPRCGNNGIQLARSGGFGGQTGWKGKRLQGHNLRAFTLEIYALEPRLH